HSHLRRARPARKAAQSKPPRSTVPRGSRRRFGSLGGLEALGGLGSRAGLDGFSRLGETGRSSGSAGAESSSFAGWESGNRKGSRDQSLSSESDTGNLAMGRLGEGTVGFRPAAPP